MLTLTGVWIWVLGSSLPLEWWQQLFPNFSKRKVTACHRADVASNWPRVHSFKCTANFKSPLLLLEWDYTIVLLIMPPTLKSSLYLLGTLLTPSRPRELLRGNSSKEEVCHRDFTSEMTIWYLYSFFYQKIWNLPKEAVMCPKEKQNN